jgi:hypothetical protein
LQIARINRLLIDAYSVTEHIDFFIGCRYPIRNARIRQFYNVNGTVLFIINMAKV